MTEEKNNLYQLPKGWIWTKLGEVTLAPQYGWTTRGVTEGRLHLLRTTDITSGDINWDSVPFCKEEPPEIEKYLLNDGDIVISRAGSVGYSQLIKNPKHAVFASYLIRFKSLINERYTALFLKSPIYWQSISQKSIGIAIPNVNASKLRQIQIPLCPLPEQHRIVTKIEELFIKLDAGVKSLQYVKAQLQLYRQAVLKYASSGKLTEEWRRTHKDIIIPASTLLERIKTERNKNSSRTKSEKLLPIDSSTLPILPEKWTWVRTADICNGIVPGRDKPKDFKGDIPWITLPDVDELYISKSKKNLGLTKEDAEKVGMKVMPKGTVLMSCVGRFGIICIAGCPVVPNQQFHGFICSNNIIPEYVAFSLMAQIRQMKELSSATTIAYLNKTKCNSITLPLAPIAEQHRIVEEIEQRFSIADEIEKTALNCIKQSERLRESILKIAFEGKLVAQDFLDEPAEKLLERIKKEKKERNSQQKTTKRKNSKTKQRRLDGYVE